MRPRDAGRSRSTHCQIGQARKRLWIVWICFLAQPALADHELQNRDLENGRQQYAAHCASCHGKNLEGASNWRTPGDDGVLPAPPHDETGHTWHHDNQLLFTYTRLGGRELLKQRGVTNFKSGMPGFKDSLTDDDIWDVLAFIRSTWPEEIRAAQTARNAPHE